MTRNWLLCAASAAALFAFHHTDAQAQTPAPAPAPSTTAAPAAPVTPAATPPVTRPAQDDTEIVITAQRREQNIQDVPIAVTALSADSLKNQRIDNGSNLANAVPNMSFQPGLYGKPDFVVRGIGYQLVTSTGDAGVAVHVNDGPVSAPRIASEDFYDVGRIEVLRGPQGTLYGRNATGGVINAITRKPTSTFDAALTGELGNFNARKAQGFINLPMGDKLALRVAGDLFQHDGYQTNSYNGHDVANVDLWSTRATLAFKPNPDFTAYAMWEHFNEDDGGNGNGGNIRGICKKDLGPTSVGTTSLTDGNPNNPFIQSFLSQGCAPTSIYDPTTLTGTVNGVGDFGNRIALALGIAGGDLLGTTENSPSRYGIRVPTDPFNKVTNDLAQLQWEAKVSDNLKLTSLTTYDRDLGRNGSGSLVAGTPFLGGLEITSPQLNDGQPSAFWQAGVYNNLKSEEWSQEFRLQSSFDGPWNFSVGGIYLNLHRRDDVFVYDNINKYVGVDVSGLPLDPSSASQADGAHYYFQSVNPYHLVSQAIFGELYWTPTDELSFTAGLRYTDDQKTFDQNTSAGNLLVGTGGNSLGPPDFAPCPAIILPTCPYGYTFGTPQKVEFKEPTGRFTVDWHPDLGFTDDTHLYASVSRGYKGGGFNPPNLIGQGDYDPEFVNAYEIGAKNQLFDKKLTLNLAGFFYDYKGYQFTQAAVFGTKTANVDAHILGAELESIWHPIDKLALNAQVGYLKSEIQPGPSAFSIDQYNLTGGDPNLSVVKTLLSTCLVNTANFAHFLADMKAGVNTAPGGTTAPTPAELANLEPFGPTLCNDTRPEYQLFAGVPGGAGTTGVTLPISGNRLPNVPAWTVSLGAQYEFDLSPNWSLIPRVDYHYQGDIYTDLFNNEDNRVDSYSLTNASVTLSNVTKGLNLQFFVKNIMDDDTVIGAASGGGAILGNPRSIVVADPRTYGVSLTKQF